MSSALNSLQQKSAEKRIAELRIENQKLETQIESYKEELRLQRAQNGIPQVSLYFDNFNFSIKPFKLNDERVISSCNSSLNCLVCSSKQNN